ncbi:hypothetical protein ACP4OV_026221 [Aristida adscensionis]
MWLWGASPMACKAKGILKGLKVFSRIFVVKEHEMEIGYPTDVKHVAHIGWNGATATADASPSWMNDVMASAELSSLGNFAASAGTSWASQDFEQQQPREVAPPFCTAPEDAGGQGDAATLPDVPRPPRRTRSKKPKRSSPPAPPRSGDSAASPPEDAAVAAATGVQ